MPLSRYRTRWTLSPRNAWRPLLAAPLLLVLFAACFSDDDEDEDGTPTATLTAEEQKREVARRVAEGVCPEDAHDACVRQFVVFAEGNRQLALCVAGDETWVFEPVGGGSGIGDACADGQSLIYAIVGTEP